MSEELLTAHLLLPDAAEEERDQMLPCGCRVDECYCGQYPTHEEWAAEMLEMELDVLSILQQPDREPTFAERLAESMKDDRRAER